MSIHIKPVGSDGTHYDIELAAKPEAKAAAMRIKSWRFKAVGGEPDTDDTVQLYDVVARGNNTITGKARAIGPDPDVTVEVGPTLAQVTVKGALMHNGRTAYPLSPADHKAIVAFIAQFGIGQ